jgi:hypothetical protein
MKKIGDGKKKNPEKDVTKVSHKIFCKVDILIEMYNYVTEFCLIGR